MVNVELVLSGMILGNTDNSDKQQSSRHAGRRASNPPSSNHMLASRHMHDENVGHETSKQHHPRKHEVFQKYQSGCLMKKFG